MRAAGALVLPCAGEDDIEVEVQVVEEGVGRGVVGDQQCHVVVIGDALVVPVSVVDAASFGVHENELCVVLGVEARKKE